MAIERLSTPSLRVIDGGSPAMRRDESRIERIAGIDEAIEGAELAYALVSGLAADYQHENRPTDLRWSQALHVVGRIGARATLARAEILALSEPEPAA